jgi:hypothetical protein
MQSLLPQVNAITATSLKWWASSTLRTGGASNGRGTRRWRPAGRADWETTIRRRPRARGESESGGAGLTDRDSDGGTLTCSQGDYHGGEIHLDREMGVTSALKGGHGARP